MQQRSASRHACVPMMFCPCVGGGGGEEGAQSLTAALAMFKKCAQKQDVLSPREDHGKTLGWFRISRSGCTSTVLHRLWQGGWAGGVAAKCFGCIPVTSHSSDRLH
eukprot:1159005-Pelagomonas_calceolata.AAC.4